MTTESTLTSLMPSVKPVTCCFAVFGRWTVENNGGYALSEEGKKHEALFTRCAAAFQQTVPELTKHIYLVWQAARQGNNNQQSEIFAEFIRPMFDYAENCHKTNSMGPLRSLCQELLTLQTELGALLPKARR